MRILDDVDGIVCDLDGVVYRGPSAVPSAVRALGSAGVRVHYATNNASRPPGVVAEQLRGMGLAARSEDVATSSQAGAWLLADRLQVGASVLAVGGLGVTEALGEKGFTPVRPRDVESGLPAAVLQGYGADVTAEDLAVTAYAVENGAVWVATNTDLTLPTERGLAPGNGSLVQAVHNAVGRAPDAVAGKPEPPLYLMCAERLRCEAGDLLAVGDRLDTDIEGAVRAGMRSVLVLTGVHGVADVLASPPERRPTWVLPDLSWLDRPVEGAVARANEAIAEAPTRHGPDDAGELARVAEEVEDLLRIAG